MKDVFVEKDENHIEVLMGEFGDRLTPLREEKYTIKNNEDRLLFNLEQIRNNSKNYEPPIGLFGKIFYRLSKKY